LDIQFEKLLAACNDGKISPVNVETEISDVVGSRRIETDIWIIIRCSHGSAGQIAELTGHITGTTITRRLRCRTRDRDS